MTSIDEINALFSWNPPPLTLNALKPSKHTRAPSFYNKHFTEQFVLRRVKHLPSLVRDLAANVDRALLAASATLPPVDNFLTEKDRKRILRSVPKVIENELRVTHFYGIISLFFTPLASTLALHPKASNSGWTPLLQWTPSVSSSGFAIMDGELRITDDNPDNYETIVETMESDTRLLFETIRALNVPFATWEMKTPFAAPFEVMHVVRNMGSFSWTFCTETKKMRETNRKHINARQKVAQIKVGDDALNPPWQLDTLVELFSVEGSSGTLKQPVKQRGTQSTAASASTSSIPVLSAKPSVRLSEASSGTSMRRSSLIIGPDTSASMLPPPISATAAKNGGQGNRKGKEKEVQVEEEEKEEEKEKTLKRKREQKLAKLDEASSRTSVRRSSRIIGRDTSASMQPPPIPASPAKNRGQGNRKGKEEEDEEKTTRISKRKRRQDDEAYKDAESLVQHAWAQATRVDGTIIVLHSGNHELVCLRHRKTQTLYVSDLIEPSTCKDPGYGKLQVGIYVAAVQDMIDRTRQRLKPSEGDRDDDQGSGSDHKDDQGRGKRRRGGSGRGNPGGAGHDIGQFQGGVGTNNVDDLYTMRTIQKASKGHILLLYLQYGVYDSSIPASFIRSASPIMAKSIPWSPRAISSHTSNDCLTIVLTSEIGRGSTGVAHRGTLKPMGMGISVPLDVVVKLAFDSEQQDMLRTEYESYRHLRSNDVLRGVTTTLGFFDDNEGGPCALVMLYAGDSLVDVPKRVLSVSECESALSTLRSIHRTGILHGDIRRENLVVSNSRVTIIDFSHSKECDDLKAMDREYGQLRLCLGCV